MFNASPIDTVVVCATTTTAHRADDPGNVELDEDDAELSEASVVNVSQIIAVDKVRLGEWIGSLGDEKMQRVMGGIQQLIWGEDLGL